jgi:hypothetical protein
MLPDEGTRGDSLEMRLVIVGERRHHRAEIAATDGLVEASHVIVEKPHVRDPNLDG